MKSNIFFKSLTLTFFYLSLSFTTLIANEKSYIFQNNTGRTVNDLHIEFTEEGVEYNSNSEQRNNMAARNPNHQIDTDDEKIHHFTFRGRRKQIANGAYIYIDFKTEGAKAIKIKNWYWTFNGNRVSTVNLGDADKATQDEDLIVDSEDIVKEYKFKNGVPKVRSGNTVEEYGINDLHIVVSQAIKVNNRSREDGNSPRKTGGVFEDTDIIPCNCDALPDNDIFNTRGENTAARRRALRALDEPCKTLCESTTEKRYVVQLKTDDVVKTGQEIPIRLIGEEDFDIIGLPWWTKDGHPITYNEDRNRDTHGGTENRPPREDETRDEMDWEEAEEAIFPVASLLPGFGLHSTKRGFTIGLGLAYSKTPGNLVQSLGPASNAEVLIPGLENEIIYFDFTDPVQYELLKEKPALQKVKQSAMLRAQLAYQLDKWEIRSEYAYQKIQQEYRIELAPLSNPAIINGQLDVEIVKHHVSLGIRRYFSESRLEPFAEAGAAMNFLHAKENQVTFEEVKYNYQKCKWLTTWGIYAMTGLRLHMNDRLFSEFRAGIHYYQSDHPMTSFKDRVSPELGLNLGILLGQ